MKPRIDVGGRQGRDERDGFTTSNGGGSYEHGMPVSYEGDEPRLDRPLLAGLGVLVWLCVAGLGVTAWVMFA